ncbi:hypothetical protein B4087_5764 [Bacillus cereus]|uniref:Uncharacterized protein n=1 Tax=Bacillus cereus TaxID=1396 RepID=A0A164Q736_BACCE|nr:hypothetical protein B4087_5764 [Bacillus cereus]KZD70035.1 hypothetical protein B4088_1214 [Bacillus cereus]
MANQQYLTLFERGFPLVFGWSGEGWGEAKRGASPWILT